MLVGLQVTLIAVMVDDCDWVADELKVPPVQPVIHNMPEKSRQSAALRSITISAFYFVTGACGIFT